MGHGVQKVYACSMAVAGTTSSEVDLGRSYQNVYLEIPTLPSSSNGTYIYAANASGGTYRPVLAVPLSSPVAATFTIATAATNCFVQIPPGYRFMKVVTAQIANSGAVSTYNFLCGD